MSSAQVGAILRHIRKLATTLKDHDLPDSQLLERFAKDRDEAAFAALLRRHGQMVLSVCRNVLHDLHDAEDAFQAAFLLLSQKAGSIHRREAVSGWLYRVAYRLAVRARANAARRKVLEKRAVTMPSPDPVLDMSLREVRTILFEELEGLPEQYRAAVVLCGLEEKSLEEAARLLGWSKGALKGRLHRGRELLRARLRRRGLELPAALSATALVLNSASGQVATTLADSTLRAAVKVAAARGAVAGLVSANVAALVQGVSKTMFLSKAKIATALLLAGSVAATAVGVVRHQASAADQPTAKQSPAESPKSQGERPVAGIRPDPETGATVLVRGRVLDPDGKPHQGAKLFLWTSAVKTATDMAERATTGDDGAFRFAVSKVDLGRDAKVLATAKDVGPDWQGLGDSQQTGEVTLRLAKDDVPITGRILDLEGRPIAGATIEVAGLDQGQDGDLKAWFKNKSRYAYFQLKHLSGLALDGPRLATTGNDGRFRLAGFGRNRVVYLRIKGLNIENAFIHAVTTTDPVPGERTGYLGVFPAQFDLAVGPSKPIVGTVREKGTGKPLAEITVASMKFNRSYGNTDSQGHYRLEGVGKSKDYIVVAEGTPYFNCTKMHIADTPGAEPITVDFELERGIPVKGRLTDKATGKPVRGWVSYVSLGHNPHLKNYSEIGKSHAFAGNWGRTADDGSFSELAIPGPGLLCAHADDANAFLGAELKEGWQTNVILESYHAVVEITVPEEDPQSVTCDIALQPARIVTGEVVDPEGKPLTGAYVAGMSPIFGFHPFESRKLESAAFAAGGLAPQKPRRIVFIHPEKKLAKVQQFRAGEQEPITVHLEPLGALTGRILDTNGQPRVGLKVAAMMSSQREDFQDLPLDLLFEYPSWRKLTNGEATTDANGWFRVDGLVPGLKYLLNIKDGQEVLAAYTKGELTVESGKTKDLGDLKDNPVGKKGAKE